MNGFGGWAGPARLPFQPDPHQHPLQQAKPAMTPTTQQQQAGPWQEKGAPGRQTYKSCDFCAKRKRKCDGKLPRCSLCVEKNQAVCHYQLKPPTKPRAGKPGALRRRPSTSAPSSYATSLTPSTSSGVGVGVGVGGVKRLAGQAPGSLGGNALSVPGTRVVAMEPGLMSLKRCRLSASPATGMVGMQENIFLSDFFGCLGILPLATERIVRDAMVGIMMEAMAPRQQQVQQPQHPQFSLSEHEHGLGGGQEGGHAYGVAGERPGLGLGLSERGCEGEDGEMDRESKTGWSGGLVGRGSDDSPGRCIMWCAVALGAIVQGAPIEYVTGYVSLAREALAACFDGSSIENARAYLMMSFLHGLIDDQEKNEKYLSFAVNIVSKLRKEDVPRELMAMILSTEKMKMFTKADCTERRDLSAYCNNLVDIPQVGKILEQKDLCHLFLVADRRMNQAFIKDMVSQGALGKDDADGLEGRGERVGWEGNETATGRGPRTRVEEVVETQPPACADPGLCCDHLDGQEEPCAGPAVKGHIQEVLPELSRLSKALGRSDSTAGIGGVFCHGNVAYMQAVNGEMANSFESLRACADIVQRYPGIVRFRPHLLHCMLAASHAWDRGMYDRMREVYNLVGHVGCRPAPPFEEWGGMRQLCEHIFCRSVEQDVHVIHKSRRRAEAASDTEVTEALSSSSSSRPGSPFDLDAALASWSGVPAGSEGEVHGSASGTVVAERVRTGPLLAEADVVVTTEPRHSQQAARQNGSSTTATGACGTADSYQHNLADPVATSKLAPAPAYPAAAEASVDWPGATEGQEHEPIARGVEAPAGAPAPELASVFMGKGSGTSEEDMGMDMTDADLLDITAVLMSEDGPLDAL